MPGSDVAVVGMVGTECFAIDYYLQSRVQCDYASGQVRSSEVSCKASVKKAGLRKHVSTCAAHVTHDVRRSCIYCAAAA